MHFGEFLLQHCQLASLAKSPQVAKSNTEDRPRRVREIRETLVIGEVVGEHFLYILVEAHKLN